MFQPSDYQISTWLLIGATLQCVVVAFLPKNVAMLPPILTLAFRLVRGYLVATGRIHNDVADGVRYELTSTQYPAPDGTPNGPRSAQSIVVLVLAASFSHPNGRLSPGSERIGGYFVRMWKDAEAQRERYGYLGNTPALVAESDKGLQEYGRRDGDDKGKTMVWISYWKTLHGLHDFAHADAHRKGWLWWERGANKEFRHIGIMHELYEVPAGNWENIFHNFRPFGIGNTRFPVQVAEDEEDKGKSVVWVSGLQPVKGRGWKSMEARMGRPSGSVGSKKRKGAI